MTFASFFPKEELQLKPHKVAWALLAEDTELEENGPSQIRKTLGTQHRHRESKRKKEKKQCIFFRNIGGFESHV